MFLKINLHHSKDAKATLGQQLAVRKVDAALVQEPWLYKEQISGLTNTGEKFILLHLIMQDPVSISGIILMTYLWWSSVLETQQQ
jgi:hypothetical protein